MKREYQNRSYVSEKGKSKEFLNVLPEKLTLHNPLPPASWQQNRKAPPTIFKEVSLSPATLTMDDVKLLNRTGPPTTLDDVFLEVKKCIMREWDPKKKHIMPHSSGYDSRVVSTAIKELREEHGDEWFGDTTFIECLGEGPEFEDIMKRQGFDKFITYNKDVEPGLYHEYSFWFDCYFHKYNGIVGFPVNMWWDAYYDLEEHGQILMNNIQFIGGYGANELDVAIVRGRGLKFYLQLEKRLQMQFMRFWADETIFPFCDHDVMFAMSRLSGLNGNRRITDRLSQLKAPHLFDIQRLSVEQFCKRGQRMMNDDLLSKVQEDYDNSWYGQRVKIKINPNFYTYNVCWGHYGAASLCEHLLRQGYKISI